MQVVGGKQGDTNTRTSLNQDMKKTHLLSKYAINVAQENVYWYKIRIEFRFRCESRTVSQLAFLWETQSKAKKKGKVKTISFLKDNAVN